MTVLLFHGSCTDKLTSQNDFLITVDSIHVPVTITSNTPFDIEFFGMVGVDGCYSFKVFNQIIKDNDITIETWGTYDSKAKVCPEVLVTLYGKKINMTIPYPGIYYIKITEPYGYPLVKQIIVN